MLDSLVRPHKSWFAIFFTFLFTPSTYIESHVYQLERIFVVFFFEITLTKFILAVFFCAWNYESRIELRADLWLPLRNGYQNLFQFLVGQQPGFFFKWEWNFCHNEGLCGSLLRPWLLRAGRPHPHPRPKSPAACRDPPVANGSGHLCSSFPQGKILS